MSTQAFQSVIRIDDPGLEDATRDRAVALDSWLAEEAPEAWAALKGEWCLPSVDSSRVRDLWLFFLAATEVARVATAGRGDSIAAVIDALRADPMQLSPAVDVPGGGVVALPCDHRVIRSDLRTVSHPGIAGSTLSGLSRGAIDGSIRRGIAEALEIVASASSGLLGMVRFHCGAVGLLAVEPALDAGKCVSLTSKLIPGIIYVTPVPPILMAESIVHESAHLCLACHERRAALYVDSAARVMTPLRPDPRPISGLMHQVWVLAHLASLYRALLASPSEAVERNRRAVEKRLALHEDGLAKGMAALDEATWGLTPEGVALAKGLASAGSTH